MVSEITRVLLVEDDPGHADFIRQALQECTDIRFEVTCFVRLEDAISNLPATNPDLVLLALSLPDSNGPMTLARLRDCAHTAPIVLLTGLDGEQMASAAVRLGARDYLIEGRLDSSSLVRSLRYAIDRYRSDQALREREQLLKAILDVCPIGIAVSAPDRTIKLLNRSCVAMFGFDHEEECIGQSAKAIYHSDEEYIRIGRLRLDVIRLGKVAEADVKFRRRDESLFDGRIRVSPLDPTDPTKGVVVGVTDRSEGQKAAIGEYEQRLELARKNAELGLWDWDGKTNRLNWNYRVTEMLGYEPEEIQPSLATWESLVHPNDWPQVYQSLQAHLNGRSEAFEVEYRIRTKSGDWSWQRQNGKIVERDPWNAPLRIVGTARDITARKRAEQMYRLLATAVEQCADAVVITDAEGKIEYANPAWEKITRYDLSEALGRKLRILEREGHSEEFHAGLWGAIRRGEIWRRQFSNKTKDGEIFEEDVTISPVLDPSGNITQLVVVERDVTNEISLQYQLRQTERMESVAALAGGLAHDFKNLLTVILGYAQLLLLDKKEGDKEYEGLRKIVHAAENGANLVRRILTFSRRIEPDWQPINLNDEIRRTEQMLRQTLSPAIEIELALDEDLRKITADPGQIAQVLLNLAVNARHAMAEGGKFTIKTERVAQGEDDRKTRSGLESTTYVLMTVSDTGHGMPKEVLDHIFEPFFTTKKPDEGAGLGLAMVYGIVKAHHGQITCYSEPSKGATFRIYLPSSAPYAHGPLTDPP